MYRSRLLLFFLLVFVLFVPHQLSAYTEDRKANNYNASVTRTKVTSNGYIGIKATVKIPKTYTLHNYSPTAGDYLAFYVGFNNLSGGSVAECGMSRSSSRPGGFEPGCKFAGGSPWDPDGGNAVNTFVTTETPIGTDKFQSGEQTVTFTLEYNPSTGNATYYIASPNAPNGNTYFTHTRNLGTGKTFNVKFTNDTYDHMYNDGAANTKISYSQMEWTNVQVKKSNGTWVPFTAANGFTSANTESIIGWSSNGNAMLPGFKNFYSIYYYNCYNTKYVTFEAAEIKNIPNACGTKEVS